MEPPNIKCPKNVEVNSDKPVKVVWESGIASDNVGIKETVFNPVNGTIFQSNTYNVVTMRTIDTSGNEDECTTEVHVKGKVL